LRSHHEHQRGAARSNVLHRDRRTRGADREILEEALRFYEKWKQGSGNQQTEE
jgi:hypothetical protein